MKKLANVLVTGQFSYIVGGIMKTISLQLFAMLITQAMNRYSHFLRKFLRKLLNTQYRNCSKDMKMIVLLCII